MVLFTHKVKNIKDAVHKNGDVGGTCRRTLMAYFHCRTQIRIRTRGCARFAEILSELTKTWSSGGTECGV